MISKDFLYDVAGVFLLAVLPLVIFLKNAEYSLLAAESFVIFGLILGFALLCGLLLVIEGKIFRIIVFTFLAILVVDVQTDWISTLGLRLLLNVIFFGGLFWLVHRHLSRILVLMVGLMVLATVVMPGHRAVSNSGEPGSQPGDDPNLPFVLHLVLDEQIGVEGIPAAFDPDGSAADELRDFYLDRSFTVFGRAYSRYGSTRESMSNMLNFDHAGISEQYLGGDFTAGDLLGENAWFDMLHGQGYRIHVLESSHLRYFNPGEDGVNPNGDTRLTYDVHSLRPLQETNLTVEQKIPFILSTYFKESYFLKNIGLAYTGLATSKSGKVLGLPAWELDGNHPVHIATMEVIDSFTEQLKQAGPGQAFFAHLMLPHSPYGFDRDCQMELRPGHWLLSKDKRLGTRYNTQESRALRYPLYLGQMFCLQSRLETMFAILEEKGLWEDAIVVIHGDHGSRISQWPPAPVCKSNVSSQDLVDSFSTLYAVKAPGLEAGYHRDLLPIDHLFSRTLRDRLPWEDTKLENQPVVYLQGVEKTLEKHPLPSFAHGRILE